MGIPSLRTVGSVIGLALSLAGPALAQDGTPGAVAEAEAVYREGATHYRAGRYDEAIRAFHRSFELSGRGALLYNLANAYEAAGRPEDALRYLRAFAGVAEGAVAQELPARLAALEQAVEAAGERPPRPPASPVEDGGRADAR